jgi:uncharacterized Zn finger protein
MPPRRTFGTTWWGKAWLDALERSATLDPSRLGRGRTYARNGSVGPLKVRAGHVSAKVTGKHSRYYRVDVAVRPLAPTEQDQVAEAIAARAAHAAALLDGDLDPGIVADLEEVDVRLLPGPGDLRTDCSCPDWAEPCKHAAAVCFLIADELDRDPFALFLLRGIGRDELMAGVRRARRVDGAELPQPQRVGTPGVPAAAAWDRLPLDAPLPAPPPEATHREPIGRAPLPARMPWDITVPVDAHVNLHRLSELALDAAERARGVLLDGRPSALRSGSRADLARRAASDGTGHGIAALASHAGVAPKVLEAWAEAWRIGGDVAVAVVADGDSWSTDQAALEEGRAALVEMGWSRRSVALSYDSLKLRGNWLVLGPDDLWYRLRGTGKHGLMRLAAPPSDDVCALVDSPDAV